MLILKMLNSIKKNKKINIYNFGKHLRDFTYIDDVVKIIFKFSKIENKKIKTFNICASNPVEINKIISLFESILKKNILVNKLPKRKGEMKITYGSNKKLKKYFNCRKFTKISHGLKKTITWYKNFKYKEFVEIHK